MFYKTFSTSSPNAIVRSLHQDPRRHGHGFAQITICALSISLTFLDILRRFDEGVIDLMGPVSSQRSSSQLLAQATSLHSLATQKARESRDRLHFAWTSGSLNEALSKIVLDLYADNVGGI